MNSSVRRIQRLLRPLQRTAVHPQWLTKRHRSALSIWLKENATGKSKLLDVGCGDSWIRSVVSDNVEYVSIDHPPTRALGYSGLPSVFANASQLPIKGETFDCVVLLDVLEHLRSPHDALLEARRVMTRGGICLIHVPFFYPLHDEPFDYQRWTSHGLTELINSAGLQVRSIEPTLSPIECGAAALSTALAKSIVDAFRIRSISLLLAPLLVFFIPLINLSGWALGRLMPTSDFMPFSYKAVATKPE